HENLQQIYSNHLNTRLAKMAPEDAQDFQRKAGKARMAGMTPEERSELSRRAIQIRWTWIAYAKNPEPADHLFAFLRDFIDANHYSPTVSEVRKAMHHDGQTTEKLLQMLEATGRIKRHPWKRGITIPSLATQVSATNPNHNNREIAQLIAPRATKKCYDCDEP